MVVGVDWGMSRLSRTETVTHMNTEDITAEISPEVLASIGERVRQRIAQIESESILSRTETTTHMNRSFTDSDGILEDRAHEHAVRTTGHFMGEDYEAAREAFISSENRAFVRATEELNRVGLSEEARDRVWATITETLTHEAPIGAPYQTTYREWLRRQEANQEPATTAAPEGAITVDESPGAMGRLRTLAGRIRERRIQFPRASAGLEDVVVLDDESPGVRRAFRDLMNRIRNGELPPIPWASARVADVAACGRPDVAAIGNEPNTPRPETEPYLYVLGTEPRLQFTREQLFQSPPEGWTDAANYLTSTPFHSSIDDLAHTREEAQRARVICAGTYQEYVSFCREHGINPRARNAPLYSGPENDDDPHTYHVPPDRIIITGTYRQRAAESRR
jgi:hypothetical protein